MAEDLRKQTIAGVVWSFIERFSVQLIQFVIGIIMARLLSPSDYGLIGMLAIFMSISQVFIDGGFSSALIQRKKRTETDYSTVFYINLTISLFFYAILYGVAPLIANFYDQPLLCSITRVYSITLVINSLVAINKVKMVIAVDFKTQSKISLTAALISGFVGVYSAYNGFAVWALVIQALVQSAVNVLLCIYFVRWKPKLVFSKKSFTDLFAYGSKLLISGLISDVYTNLYALFIGKKFSPTTLGFYTRGQQLSGFVCNNVSSILTRVSFPIFSKIQDDNERLVSAYQKYIKMAAFVVFPVTLWVCGNGRSIVLFLLTDKWADCIIVLQILCFAYLWDIVTMINLNLLKVKGRTDLTLRLEIIKKSIAFTILFITIYYFDLVGVCVGQAVYSIIAVYLNTYYTKRILGYSFMKQMRDVFPYLICSLLIMVVGLILNWLISIPLLCIIVSAVVSATIYFVICYLFKFEAFKEVLLMTKRK